jgi:hypothetical protein
MAASNAVVVAEAEDPVQAGKWLDALEQAGIAARSFERGVGAALGGAVTSGFAKYPVLVARDDLLAARNVISRLDGGGVLSPVRDEEAVRATQLRWLVVAVTAIAVVLVLGVASRVVAG